MSRYNFSEEYEFTNETRPQKKRKRRRKKSADNAKVSQAITISVVSVLIVACMALFIGFSQTGLTSAQEENTVVTEEMLPALEDTGFVNFTFMATGDNLLHTKLYTEANQRAGGTGYDFDQLYAGVADLLKDADIAFINQETPLATAIADVSSYPMFNTPSECVYDLHEIGFNVFNIVSNHTLDKGADGVKATIDVMEGMDDTLYVGSYYNKEEMEKLHYLEQGGIKVAFLGFTEMTNGLELSPDSEIAFTYTSDEAEMEKLIKDADTKAEVVIVSVHWGEENVFNASDAQKQLAQKFADWGADLVIGHHPHVLEQIESVTSADGRTVPVVYSLGNFTSTMNLQANHIGGFFKCNVIYNKADKSVAIADEEFIPLINYFTAGKNNIRVLPVSEYTQDLENNNGLGISSSYINDIVNSTVGNDLVRR